MAADFQKHVDVGSMHILFALWWPTPTLATFRQGCTLGSVSLEGYRYATITFTVLHVTPHIFLAQNCSC